MDVLNQIGGLLLGSVPTVILFVLLYFAYTTLVRKPLERILAERRARTIGAVEQARGAIAAAEAETAVLEDKLRAARMGVNAWREQQAQARQREREAVLQTARDAANAQIRTARGEIDAASAEARRQIEANAEQLSDAILHAILPRSGASSEVRA